jgi:DNA replication protein DnaC
MWRGKTGVFAIIPDMLDRIRNAYRSKDVWEQDGSPVLATIRDADVVVLDDLGAQRTNDWVIEELFKLIAYRHSNQKRTIVTSNLDAEDLAEQFGHERAPSRILERARCEHRRWALDVNALPDLRTEDDEAF